VITVHRQNSAVEQIALETVADYEFHRSIVAYLTTGTPMSVSAVQSRNVVAIMQAAEESALNNAMPVVPKLRADNTIHVA
jgi:hypothetical protein